MIQSFKDKALRRLFEQGDSRGIPQDLAKRIRVRLEAIDSATVIDDLRLPGYNLHELMGDRKGTWSIRISGNWRITFTFAENDAHDLDFEDYH
jgi:toxin HigB-1